MFKGRPFSTFSKEDVDAFSRRFRFALVGLPCFTVGGLSHSTVLINFELDEDYQRFFYRQSWTISKDNAGRGFQFLISPFICMTQKHSSPSPHIWVNLSR
ncbi:unnamed protein product [Cuscuta campestris]|uniref:DUF4283 domain-containing protein n=1 Tax=Cuscuta campestris TaxID=132261 RepID=A0A484K8A2_9ASTE|nr:unnamed protein product [Cuscuta campestris]